jgi:hypothetical protein
MGRGESEGHSLLSAAKENLKFNSIEVSRRMNGLSQIPEQSIEIIMKNISLLWQDIQVTKALIQSGVCFPDALLPFEKAYIFDETNVKGGEKIKEFNRNHYT